MKWRTPDLQVLAEPRPDAVVIPLFPRQEIINGVALSLGQMSLEELQGVQADCQLRYEQARDELHTITDIIDGRFGDGGLTI